MELLLQIECNACLKTTIVSAHDVEGEDIRCPFCEAVIPVPDDDEEDEDEA